VDEHWNGGRASLDPPQRSRYEELLAGFTALGAPAPERWALSEVAEDIPSWRASACSGASGPS
jgi:hypothetical protein